MNRIEYYYGISGDREHVPNNLSRWDLYDLRAGTHRHAEEIHSPTLFGVQQKGCGKSATVLFYRTTVCGVKLNSSTVCGRS